MQFQVMAELQLNTKIIFFQSDVGGEFQALTSHFAQTVVIHLTSCSHTHEQNGIVERKYKLLNKDCLCLLKHLYPWIFGMKVSMLLS